MFQNLVVGLEPSRQPSLSAVIGICEELGLARRWLDHLLAEASSSAMSGASDEGAGAGATEARPKDAEAAARAVVASDTRTGGADQEQAWERQLSSSDKCILHLARAIIANPHLLVIHRPLAAFEPALAKRVLTFLRSFVEGRGVGDQLYRTPGVLARTVIFTCSIADAALDEADGFLVTGLPPGGATFFDPNMLHDTTSSQESRSAAIRRQIGALVPASRADLPEVAADESELFSASHRQQLNSDTRRSKRVGRGFFARSGSTSTPGGAAAPSSDSFMC